MSIYKPSLPRPDLAEIDVLDNDVEFQVQINTSGTVVKQFVVEIWSADGEELVFRSGINDVRPFIQNKGTLKWKLNDLDDEAGQPPSRVLKNGKDYQWTIRVYEEPTRTAGDFTRLPKTFVCSGYLVGSTKNVLWVQDGTTSNGVTNQNDKLEEGKYVQITCVYQNSGYGEYSPNRLLPPTPPNAENLILPIDYSKNTSEKQIYKERHKIEYLTNELGENNNISKIELDEPFKYNYIDGVHFQVYNCANNHSLTSVYVDPNDIIERGKFIKISTSSSESSAGRWRKIIGYGEDTGEVRVQENFDSVPTDGMYYWIGETEGDGIKLVTNPLNNIVGGQPWSNQYWVMSNKWGSGSDKRLFIQPNINILPDEHNPDTIMIRANNNFLKELSVDIQDSSKQNISKGEDGFIFKKDMNYTFDKLDNTQWLLKAGVLQPNPDYYANIEEYPLCYPQTPYKVYTDFQDLSPNGYFYARTAPIINIGMCGLDLLGKPNPKDGGKPFVYQYINWEEFFNSGSYLGWRDITFKAQWIQEEGVQTKYYQYTLYDENNMIIGESEEKYDIDYTWEFRGFLSPENLIGSMGTEYAIEIKIVDQYGKEFVEKAPFRVKYGTENGDFNVVNITFDCNEMAFEIQTSAPDYVLTNDLINEYEQYTTVDVGDLRKIRNNDEFNTEVGVLSIPKGEILNYDRLNNAEKTPYNIPDKHTFYAQFQLTSDFTDGVDIGGENTILEYSYFDENLQKQIPVKLTFGGITSFYMQGDSIQENEKRFKVFIYVDNEPANLFVDKNNRLVNYIDLREKRPDFAFASDVHFVLQSNEDIILISEFPDPRNGIDETRIYLLTNDVYDGKGRLCSPGPYIYNAKNKEWQVDSRYEYVYINNVNQAPLIYRVDTSGTPLTGIALRNQVAEKMKIPQDCFSLQTPESGEISYWDGIEENDNIPNYWVDNENIGIVNKKILSSFWFEFYFVHDGEKNITTAQLDVNDSIKLPTRP